MVTARPRFCAIGLATLLAVLSASQANETTIKLARGAGSLLTLDTPFESVLVGDPKILDVSPQTDRTVMLKGLNCGSSNVVFLDGQSMAIANFRVVVSEARASL